MYEISDKAMKNWKVELTTGGKTLAEAKIQGGIFQGNAISPLLLVIPTMTFKHTL